MKIDLSYIKTFDYVGTFKDKTFQYFEPAISLYSTINKIDLSYIKTFDYVDTFKEKTYQYFEPAINLYSKTHEKDQQISWFVLDKMLVELIISKNNTFQPSVSLNNSCINDSTNYLSVLNEPILQRLKLMAKH